MSGVNKVLIVGNLGQDPEIRYTQQGSPVASFSVATSEKWKDKNTGQQNEDTQWHNITAFGKLAEIIQQYVKKGSKVYVEGKLKTESWEKDGAKHYKTVIVARELQMLDSQQQQPQAQQQQTWQQQPQRPQAPQQPQQQGAYNANQQQGQQAPQQYRHTDQNGAEFIDDISF